MNLFSEKEELEVQDAKWMAQFIAFAPFVFQLCHCLKKFNIFTYLQKNSDGASFSELQTASGLSEYSLSVLLDAGQSSKLLKRNSELYQITQVGIFINSDEISKVNMDFTKDICYSGLDQLDESLEKNIPAGLKHFGNWSTLYEGLTQLPAPAQKSWFAFDHFYSSESFPRALPIIFKSNPKTILDIGSNTGKFARHCLEYSDTVKVTLVDHPAQLSVAKQHLTDLGLVERAQFMPINLLDHTQPLPQGFDLIWMSQFLDCFAGPDIVRILQRCRQSMSASTELFIMETFTDKQKFATAKFCLDMTSLYFTCMANGNSRMYRATDFYEFIKLSELRLVDEVNHIRLSHSLLKCQL